MEEDAYRSTYRQFNQTRCAFEKAILTRRCNCVHAHKFCLAEREGIACQANPNQQRCLQFLELARQKARFVLQLTRSDEPLPHAKEIRVQLGSLSGLAQSLEIPLKDNEIGNIDTLLSMAEQNFTSLNNLPFDSLIRAIKETQGRRPRRKTGKS
jgi:hypothetical protein